MASLAAPQPPPAALPSDGLLLELLGSPSSPRACAASDGCLSLGSLGSPSSPRSRDGETRNLAAAADPRPAPAAAGSADSTATTSPQSTSQPVKQPILDLDPHRLAQRQKQIDFGKNTIGYQRYLQLVPRNKRRRTDPATPDIHANISKRRFDGQVVVWRRALHKYDDDAAQDGVPSASSASASSAATVPRQQQHSRSSRGSCSASSYPSTSSTYSYGTAGRGLSVVVPPAHPPPPMLAECTSLASYSDAACGDGSTVLSVTASAGPSSPTSSCGGSRRSLDGYLEPQQHHSSHHSHSSRRRRTLMSEEGEEEDAGSLGFQCEVLPRERSGGKAKAAAVGGECRRQASSSGGASDAACSGLWAQGKQASQGQGRRGPQQPGLSREQLQRLAEQHKHLAAAAAALVPVVVVAGDDDGGADPIVAYHPVYETEAGHRMVMTRGGVATTAPAAGGSAEVKQLLALPVEVVYGSGAEVLGFRDHRQAVAATHATAGVITFGVAVRASQAAAAQLDVGMGAGCSAVVVVEKPTVRLPEPVAAADAAADNARPSRPCGAAASVAEGEERALVDSLTSLLLQ